MPGSGVRENIMMAEHSITQKLDFLHFRAHCICGSLEKNNFYSLLHIDGLEDHLRKLFFFSYGEACVLITKF